MKFKNYLKKEQKLITWGVTVGLVLGVGVWLVVLNDLGARLATVGAFIAAILTPVIAFIVNNFLPTTKRTTEDSDKSESASRNSRIIVMSALIALIVTVAVVWVTPRAIGAVQDYYYQSFDTESVDLGNIQLTNATDMKDGDTSHLTLPKTKHQQLTIQFTLKNTASTNLCTNAATLQITTPTGETQTVAANADATIALQKTNDNHHLSVKLLFLPETDPSCTLTLEVTSASYSK